jgi:hypothetical protein
MPRGAEDLERGSQGRPVETSTQWNGLGGQPAFERKQVGRRDTTQRGRQSRKGASETIGGLANFGNQRGETSEGCEPHECDQAEIGLGIIGRCQSVERLRKPEDASKSELGKVGQFLFWVLHGTLVGVMATRHGISVQIDFRRRVT